MAYFIYRRRQTLGTSSIARNEPEIILRNEHNAVLVNMWKTYISLGHISHPSFGIGEETAFSTVALLLLVKRIVAQLY